MDEALRDALLARILEATPAFFERAIIDLLLAMGYGGSRADAGEQLGGTGDGGVDGVIREDQLGLDRGVPAGEALSTRKYDRKRDSTGLHRRLGRPRRAKRRANHDIDIFEGGAERGKSIWPFASLLIDGNELTNLKVRFLGVRVARTVEIKRIDMDYFGDVEPE